jgi:hypothetical protein
MCAQIKDVLFLYGELRGDRDFARIMGAQRPIIEPNRQVDCLVIRRSLMAK